MGASKEGSPLGPETNRFLGLLTVKQHNTQAFLSVARR